MGATARTALLLPLAALAGCARLMGYHPQEWYDARTACRQEMNERVPRSEALEIRGAYVEQCMKDRGFPNWTIVAWRFCAEADARLPAITVSTGIRYPIDRRPADHERGWYLP
jgi:hypothetical protein